MAIDPTILAEMQAQARAGKLDYCEYYKVEWASGVKYYSYAPVSRFAPFTGVKKYTGGAHVEKRVIAENPLDPFKQFELQPDIRTKDIAFDWEDADKAMTALFQANGTTRVRVYHYWPQFDVNYQVWMGQVHPPQIYGRKTLKTNATNGKRARETKTPWETHQFYCPATYGELLTTQFANETGLCPVNVHLGGPIGVGGFDGCPKDLGGCDVRTLDGDRYFGGWDVKPVSYTSDPHLGFAVKSKGSNTLLDQAKRVIAGRKHIAAMYNILFVREPNNSHPDLGLIRSMWEVGITVSSITNVKVNEQAPNPGQWAVVVGNLGQGTLWTLLGKNLSGTAMVLVVNGLGNPSQQNAQSLHAECDVLGYPKVAVFTDDDPLTYTRICTDDRVWWLLEEYTNQRFGMGMSPDEFWIDWYITVAARLRENVRFTLHGKDGEVRNFDHRRSTFNAVLEGRAFDEQVVDICRSGRITPPFLYEGKYGIDSFRAFTGDELDDAPIVTDIGPGNNIVWQDGLPNIDFSQKDPIKITNRLKVNFEEFSNKGLSRPIWCDDPDAQLAAGRAESDVDQLKWVDAEMTAFGVDELNEAVKTGYGWVWFGQLGEGGTHNNVRATFIMPYELTLGFKRYQLVKMVSDLNTFETPDGDPFEYFQILYMYKLAGGLVQVIAQGYNQQKMEAFETGITPPSETTAMVTTDAGNTAYDGTWPCMGTRNGHPWYQKGIYICEAVWNGALDYDQYRMWLGYGPIAYVCNSEVDYPDDDSWTAVSAAGPAPTVTRTGTSPDPAEVPMIPPVDTSIAFGTLDQGERTLTVPIDVV